MKKINSIGLKEVQAVYTGPEGELWELIMGEQIHIGGFASSMDLAEKAGIGPGMKGVDLCCCNGAGMRFLVRFRDIARMKGVDATQKVVCDRLSTSIWFWILLRISIKLMRNFTASVLEQFFV